MHGQRVLSVLLLCSLFTTISRSQTQSHIPPPRVGGITLTDVIRLSQAGLSDNTITSQIKMRTQPFTLSPDELLQLKAANVSDRVIEAMAGTSALVMEKHGPTHLQPLQRSVPTEPGMYLATSNGNTKILGQIVTFRRSGSLFVHTVTFSIKAAKENVQLLGPHAQTAVDGQPVFYFIPAKQEADAGVNAGDVVLVRLEEKAERRQFEIRARGFGRKSSGIALTHQIQLLRTEETQGVYKITVADVLAKGEYALYMARGEGMAPYVYDFSSSGGSEDPR